MAIKNEHTLNTRRLIIILAALLAILFISLFISAIWNKDNYAPQLIAALLSAIVTTVITLLLLNGQSDQEEKKEKSSKVFEEKLRIYLDFMKTLSEIVKDGKIDKGEEVELQFQAAYLAMHTSPKSIDRIGKSVSEIIMKIKKNSDDKYDLLPSLFSIVKILQDELYDFNNKENPGNAASLDSALSSFQSILVEPEKESVSIYERVKRIRDLIGRHGINRQWIYKGTVIVHDAYMDGTDSQNNLASDLIFHKNGSAELQLFTRNWSIEETKKVLADTSIWGDVIPDNVGNNARYLFKSFPSGTPDEEIVTFMEDFVQKMVLYRDKYCKNNDSE